MSSRVIHSAVQSFRCGLARAGIKLYRKIFMTTQICITINAALKKRVAETLTVVSSRCAGLIEVESTTIVRVGDAYVARVVCLIDPSDLSPVQYICRTSELSSVFPVEIAVEES